MHSLFAQENKSSRSRLHLMLFVLPLLVLGSCKKFVEVSPPETSATGENVYTSDATAAGVLTGLYQKMNTNSTSQPGGIPSLTLFPGLSADEFTFSSGVTTATTATALAYYYNALTGNTLSSPGTEFWSALYPFIFTCNDAILGLNGSSSITPAVRQQALGEAKFMRAFFYFYLVNLYGDVPLVLSNNYKINSVLARTPRAQVYRQIVDDLHEAQSLLSAQYLDATLLNSTADRVRPTQWAATALLARTYLYMGNWAGADSAASAVVGNTALFGLSSPANAFLRASLGNKEAIWQLQPVQTSTTNTFDAYIFIIPAGGPGTGTNFGAYLSNSLLNGFEANDLREQNWVKSITVSGKTYYYPFKYKLTTGPVNEHLMILRLAEQYLIRAEARAQEGDADGARADLNVIRTRAGLPNTTAASQSDLLSAIMHERQVELFAELGHRWLDLKRTGTMDATMSAVTPQKSGGGAWQSYQQWYPIRLTDIQLDPQLTQNEGY